MAEEAEGPTVCEPGGGGLFFPLFEGEQYWDNNTRVVLYFVILCYIFMGVSYVADKFVEAIEAICSVNRRVWSASQGKMITVQVWNGTVANLTLMAVGTSAPEIILAIAEAFIFDFHSGELGPGTIVGSAAFNMFAVTAVCIYAVPSPELRRIEKDNVFAVTATFSVIAYFWLLFIVTICTPDVVDIWEALVTLALFPALVWVAYRADTLKFPFSSQRLDLEVPGDGAEAPLHDGQLLGDGPMHGGHVERSAATANPAGALGFRTDNLELVAGLDAVEFSVPVFRDGGSEGSVSCKYRFQALTAVPGYDYQATAGELQFPPHKLVAQVPLKLLPKRLGEHSDQFQIVLEDVMGGAQFDVNGDGSRGNLLLTVTILNANDPLTRNSMSMLALQYVDSKFNIDAMRLGTEDWKKEVHHSVRDAGGEEGETSSTLDWFVRKLGYPWNLLFSVTVPPTAFFGGWFCFWVSLFYIGFLTLMVIDFANLFGCVAGVPNSIMAITIVAIGTSLPDMFASKIAAVKDETADASIGNVTGSNGVNCFLGLGLPWSICAIYWGFNGPTEEWTLKYGKMFPDLGPDKAVFVVIGGDLSFGVLVFSIGAFAALAMLRMRRQVLGGELGGPMGSKVFSALFLVLLWAFYLGPSIWKIMSKATDAGSQAVAIFVSFCILENLLLVCGIVFYLCGSKAEGGKEGLDVESGRTDSFDVHHPPLPPPAGGPLGTHVALRVGAGGLRPVELDAHKLLAGTTGSTDCPPIVYGCRKTSSALDALTRVSLVALAVTRFRRPTLLRRLGAFHHLHRGLAPPQDNSAQESLLRTAQFQAFHDATQPGSEEPPPLGNSVVRRMAGSVAYVTSPWGAAR